MIYIPTDLSIVVQQLQVSHFPSQVEVLSNSQHFSAYPQQLKYGTEHPDLMYSQKAGYYAIYFDEPRLEVSGSISQFNQGKILVFQGNPQEAENAINTDYKDIGPVYSLSSSDSLVVPTGLVLIRFSSEVTVNSRQEEIEKAGYQMFKKINYAPNAAWLTAKSGKISDSLLKISYLEAISDVENVEPQMLQNRYNRHNL